MNILSFDIEDWFHILDNESTQYEAQWADFPSRIERNTERLLRVLTDMRRPATFFCLGWAARRYPRLIRRIDALGYEIACHSDQHQLVYAMTADTLRNDLRTAIDSIEQVIGKKIRAFRAPGFSITEGTPWAFEALIEAGITIDSSVFPADRAHGGYEGFSPVEPTVVRCQGMELKELPINIARVWGREFVFSGGGYFRLLPYPLIRRLMKQASYVMTYFHPRDFDPDQPMVPGCTGLRRFKSYVGLKRSFGKLQKLLVEFPFVDIAEADRQVSWDSARRVDVMGTPQAIA